jgi:hypothetical protein
MNEHCFHEGDWGAMKAIVEHLSKEIDGNGSPGLSKTVPVLNRSVNDLCETVGELRTAISGLAKFTESIKGAEEQKKKGFNQTLKVIGAVIAFTAVILTIVGMNKRTEEKVRDIVDQYGYDVTTRSGEYVPWTRDSTKID